MADSAPNAEERSEIDLVQYVKESTQWLDSRFAIQPGVPYVPHQPVYGFLPQYLAHFRLAYALAERVRQLSFGSFLDVGGAEGYFPNLIKQLYGDSFPAYHLDISTSAIRTGHQLYQLKSGTVGDIARLPLADNSVDLVFCNDVIEHVPDPSRAVQEMTRVAAQYLIVSTWACSSEAEKQLFKPDFSYPHTHLHAFTREDIYAMMGQDILLERFHSTLPGMLAGQHEMYGSIRLLRSALRLLPTMVRQLRGNDGEMYWVLLRYLIRQFVLSICAAVSPDKEGWTRRRLVDALLTDEWLSTRYPMHTFSFLAIKDCGGGGLPAPMTNPVMDNELLEVMWSRSGVDKSIFGHDDEGRIFLRPEAVRQ